MYMLCILPILLLSPLLLVNENICIKKNSAEMFIVPSFLIASNWMYCKCLNDEWIKKFKFIYVRVSTQQQTDMQHKGSIQASHSKKVRKKSLKKIKFFLINSICNRNKIFWHFFEEGI